MIRALLLASPAAPLAADELERTRLLAAAAPLAWQGEGQGEAAVLRVAHRSP